MERIIHIGSNEGDIVLDFFAGSGTTAAVALKMSRQFITTEQMDYIENITTTRLKKVINRRTRWHQQSSQLARRGIIHLFGTQKIQSNLY